MSTARRWLLPTAVYAVILGLSSIPDTGFDGLALPAWSAYVAHAVEYAALGSALRWALGPGTSWPAIVLTILLGALAGGLDETYQRTVPGRDASLLDWAVDVASVSAAALATGFVHRSRTRGSGRPLDERRLP